MTSARTRIAYLSHAFMVGGAEEMVLNLVRQLPGRFEPMVCCINQAGPIGEEIRRTGVPFEVLGLNPGLRRPFDLNGIRRYLRETKPDIVHTFLLTASLYGRLAAILERVPVVIGTEVNIYGNKRPAHAIAERILMRGTDRVIVSAESVRDFYIRQVHADPAKVEVVYNAVDWSQLTVTMPREAMRDALGVPPGAFVAGVIARLTEQKGHRYLFEALATHRALAAVHLIVVGDGNLRETLQLEVAARGLEPRVHFLGARRDLGNLLGAMDLFVLPSLWEGLPLSLVLAMGAKLPVVSTAVAGIPEVVENGRTGLLVEPGDAAALGAALARVVTDPAFGRQLAEAGQASVLPRFGSDRYVDAIVRIYDELLATCSREGSGSSNTGARGPREESESSSAAARASGGGAVRKKESACGPREESEPSSAAARASEGGAVRETESACGPREESESSSAAARASGGGAPRA